MGKNIELARVRRGERFTLDGVEFVKLDDMNGEAFVLMADVIPETCPFERDEDREDANNFDGSHIQGVIYRWAEQHKGTAPTTTAHARLWLFPLKSMYLTA